MSDFSDYGSEADYQEYYGYEEEIGESMIEELKCPDCDGPMVSRKNKSTGEIFWGCKLFPKCRGTRDSEGRSKFDREIQREDKDSAVDNPKFKFQRASEADKNRFRNEG